MIFNRRVPFFAGVVMVVALLLSLFAPLPFVIIKPGPAQNVLGSNIQISHAKTFNHPGKLFSTSVLVSNPDSKMFGPELIFNWVVGDSVVLPRAALYPKAESSATAKSVGAKEMSASEESATIAALAQLKRSNPEIAAGVTGADIKIALKETGGPSAGLIFALGLLAKLTPTDFIKGRSIAGTGTIDNFGAVGPIGGIDQKLIGARRAGAELFLAPEANCRDITRTPAGLKVVPVASLSQALSVLTMNNSANFPSCHR